jgi:hypothetical protein
MTVRALARRLIGVWLMVDGVMTGMWFSGLADSLAGRDIVSVAVMVARVIVAALSVIAGWLITQRRPQGAPFGVAALILMAMLGLFSAWTGVLPSNLDPSFRWPAALLQATIAAVAVFFLRNETQEHPPDGTTGP